jgi:WD40 repeat protein
LFDFQSSNENLEILAEHTEFVYGLDWNNGRRNEIATCSWDKTVKISSPLCLRGT